MNKYSEQVFTRPSVYQTVSMSWPIPWTDGVPEIADYEASSLGASTSASSPVAPNLLFQLLERSAKLRCRDQRDKLFALLSLFERNPPSDIAVRYNKTPRQVYVDLSWYLISHGVFEVLSLARGATSGGMASLPSWAVDWTSHPRPRRLAFNTSSGVPNQTRSPPSLSSVKIETAGDHLVLRGRLLHDRVANIDDHASRQVAGYRGFRTSAGLEGLGTRHLEAGDTPCLFEGYDMPLLLRPQTHNAGGAEVWRLVGECWLYNPEASAERLGFDMDWSKMFPWAWMQQSQVLGVRLA